ncbi:AaceriAGL350Cp [[Ashbya] aceris (nom. inval.)]|nr:AaceriAGL350Cp [[Ashbya] aceris (nom. inval.)]
MGLAATKTKQRFGLDPRNTTWSNDRSRFGHKYLEKLGWEPGKGLGQASHAMSTHIKVTIKDDTLGLGAKLKKKEKKDEFDSGECAGLDVFQRILGRLNGKEEVIADELEQQRKDKIINGKWGIHFVKGEVLSSTWDADTMQLKSYSNDKKEVAVDDAKAAKASSKRRDEKIRGKREKGSKAGLKEKSRDKEESRTLKKKEREQEKGKDKEKKHKEKKHKEKKHKEEKEEKKEKKEKKKEKKEKKEKNEKKEKKASKKRLRTSDSSDDLAATKSSKKLKTKPADTDSVTRDSMLQPRTSAASPPPTISTRLSVRSKWIRQKRAAVMDPKALNEIFMVT